MRPDTSAPIIAAARKRHALARAKTIQTLRELDRTGAPVTFQAVADAAGVSRSWLYSQPDIRAEIQHLRDVTHRAPTPGIPADQRTSEASALVRLEAALKRNRELSQENQRLRRQLAQALGEQRQRTGERDSDNPTTPTPASLFGNDRSLLNATNTLPTVTSTTTSST